MFVQHPYNVRTARIPKKDTESQDSSKLCNTWRLVHSGFESGKPPLRLLPSWEELWGTGVKQAAGPNSMQVLIEDATIEDTLNHYLMPTQPCIYWMVTVIRAPRMDEWDDGI